ncbi:hypothetical protein ACHMW6_02070 [Pseudoduganella sp. UC29_106]|uniref:hypothetical protein n=1 Tax=Pseudoduganella sp. UC29_106 TaxID=3374553 RepID=UPI003757E47F
MNRVIPFLAALAIALPAAAQSDSACAGGLCSASGLSAATLADAAREPTPRPAAISAAEPAARNAWDLHMPSRAEDYSCALSFGVGGELGKGGFLGARALGQTRVLRDGAGK